MKIIVKQVLVIGIYLVTYGVFKLFNTGVMLPIGTFLLSAFFMYDHLKFRSLSRSMKAIKLKKNNRFNSLFNVLSAVLGVVFFTMGFNPSSYSISYFGLGTLGYLGVLHVVISLTVYHDYELLLFQDHLIYKRYGRDKKLVYDQIDKVEVSDSELIFHTNGDTVEYGYFLIAQPAKVLDFLKRNIGDKVAVKR